LSIAPLISLLLGILSFLFPSPRAYDAPIAPGRVTVDGALDDTAWSAAPWTDDFVDILGPEAPSPSLRTRAKLLWDDQYLYVGAEMEEPHLWATLRDRDAIIYQDDDFEVFIDPEGDGLAYFEIEVNAYGTVLDLFLNRPYRHGGRANLGWDVSDLKVGVALNGTLNDPKDTDHGWSVEIAIPWAGLVPPGSESRAGAPDAPERSWQPGHPPAPGDSWWINFSRVDWPLEVVDARYRRAVEPSPENRHPESNWVWSPQGVVDMHIPERWGVVRFVSDQQNSPFKVSR
jgi:hypothetical protein